MTLRHLQIFRAVCQCGGITAAAESLNMTQPAVSLAVRELETFYRVRLFDRMNRRVYLTEAGHSLLGYVDAVLLQFEESISVLRDADTGGKCRFGVNVTVGEIFLADILRQLSARAPEVTPWVTVQNSREIERLLSQNEIDFAVVDHITVSDSYRAVHLRREQMTALCAPGYRSSHQPLTLSQLKEERLLLREKGSGTRGSIDGAFQTLGCSVTPVMESVSTDSLLACAAAGQGITILPESLAQQALAAGTLVRLPLADCSFERSFFLTFHRNKYLTNGMKAAIGVIQAVMGDTQPN